MQLNAYLFSDVYSVQILKAASPPKHQRRTHRSGVSLISSFLHPFLRKHKKAIRAMVLLALNRFRKKKRITLKILTQMILSLRKKTHYSAFSTSCLLSDGRFILKMADILKISESECSMAICWKGLGCWIKYYVCNFQETVGTFSLWIKSRAAVHLHVLAAGRLSPFWSVYSFHKEPGCFLCNIVTVLYSKTKACSCGTFFVSQRTSAKLRKHRDFSRQIGIVCINRAKMS